MLVELKRCITWLVYLSNLLFVRHNSNDAKFHHCVIWVTDFREEKLFFPLSHSCTAPKGSVLNREILCEIKFFVKILKSKKEKLNLCFIVSIKRYDLEIHEHLFASTNQDSRIFQIRQNLKLFEITSKYFAFSTTMRYMQVESYI